MTVLFQCGGSYVSGMEVVELAVMRGLVARGHRVHALVSGWHDGDFVGRLDAAGLPYTEAHLGKITVRRPAWMVDTLRHLPGARRRARRLLRSLRPDVVVACNHETVLLLTGVLGDAPVVYHTHDALPAPKVRRLRRRADRFIAVSAFVGRHLAAAGVEPDRIDVVHNGVDPAPGVPRPSREVPTVGVCGQIGPWKGHDDLVAALDDVARRDVPFRLRVYGRGPSEYVSGLKARVAAGGWAGRVEWMGFERDAERMYAGIDVLAAPSRFEEPFGMTLIEAGVRGLPVVATDVGGMPEVVVDGETGVLVPAEAPDALADALAALAADRDRRQRLGEAARARVRERFLTEHMVEGLERSLGRAVERSALAPEISPGI